MSKLGTDKLIDITAIYDRSGPPVGISRVVSELYRNLDLTPVFYWSVGKKFLYADQNKNEVDFSKHGSILMTGCGWDYPEHLRIIQSVKSQNKSFKVCSLVYDIIPAKFSFLVLKETSDLFKEWLEKTIQLSDLILTISKNSANDIYEFAMGLGSVPPHISIFRLGDAELPIHNTEANNSFGSHVMYVSTIGPRKNQSLLLDAWEVMQEESNIIPKLLLVGKLGWHSDKIVRRIESSKYLSKNVFINSGIDDQELSHLYRTCMFTVYPSRYEGWGLPIGESLMYKKPVIASSSSSMPEVASSGICFLPPEDPSEWAKQIQKLVVDKSSLAELSSTIDYRPHKWIDAVGEASDLLQGDFFENK